MEIRNVMNQLEKALLVAEKAHGNQSYDIYPYMYHIRQAVSIGKELGYSDSILVALALHDTLEDTELSFNDLSREFGAEVAEIVFCVTDELGRNRKERKEKTYPKIKGNWKATVVKICDRIANVSHSKGRNNRLYVMYAQEQKQFHNSIHDSNHPIEVHKAWDRLDSLFS